VLAALLALFMLVKAALAQPWLWGCFGVSPASVGYSASCSGAVAKGVQSALCVDHDAQVTGAFGRARLLIGYLLANNSTYRNRNMQGIEWTDAVVSLPCEAAAVA